MNASAIKRVPFDVRIGGLTDCVGPQEKNTLSLPPGGSWPNELTTIKHMSLSAENFSILSMFIKPDFAAPNNCSIDSNGLVTC